MICLLISTTTLKAERDTLMTGATVTTAESFERGGGIAVWRRIADAIEAEIAAGNMAQGDKLPTEATLAQRFGVNRHTVRRALAALAADGVVESTRGSGTFVGSARIPYPIGPSTRFSAIMTAEGHVAGAELIGAETVAASRVVAEALEIGEGAPVLQVKLKRLSDGMPVSLGTSFLPLPRFAGFPEALRAQGAVTPALKACGVQDYSRRETRISARLATGAEAATLQLEAERIVLMATGLNVDDAGVPIQFTEALFAASRIELVVGSAI